MQKLEWHTEKRKVNDLVPFSQNPRIISNAQLESLKQSLKRFGLVEIPVIDTDNQIAAGHQRLKVLQLMGKGEEEIDVRVPSRKLTKKEFEQYLLTSNAVRGDWDYDILKSFDMDLLLGIGFNEDELSRVWDSTLETEDDNWSVEAELKKLKKATVKTGELYSLGPHRLICSDSQDINAIRRLVGNTRIDVINFDPPFNIGISYEFGIGGKRNYGGKVNDKKTDTEYRLFLKSLLQNSLAVSKDNVHVFTWCDQNYIGLVQSLYEELEIERKRVCVWIKNNQNPVPKVAFNKATESCVYGTQGKPYLSPRILNLNEIANKEVGSGTRTIDDILDFFEIWLVKRLATSEYEHPTQKPPTLYEKSLRRCGKAGDAILDVCAGSASIMVACEQLKRRAFLSEIDPIFATLILKRYEQITHNKPKRIN